MYEKKPTKTSKKAGNKNVNRRRIVEGKPKITTTLIKTDIKKNRGLFFFAKIFFVVFTIIVLFNLGTNLHKITSKKEELELLKQEHNSKRIKNEALKQQLKAPIDDDYIMNIVKQMGYRKANEILFYLNSED